ncbi:MAG: hypothetical protein ACK504_10555 [Bacteroidota bacterium]
MGKINIEKKAILITGTIVPNSIFVAHHNVEQRKQEYIDGLTFYKSQFPNDDVFFLENSSHDFNADTTFNNLLKNNQITLIKFPISTKTQEGKGYQEFEMLDSTIGNLKNQYSYFVKVTGRYKVLNIKDIVKPNNSLFIADSHKKHKVTQTNVFCVNGIFYNDHLKNLYLRSNDSKGIFIEHVVYDYLIKNHLLKNTNLFHKNPIISGFSGSYGGTLNRNKYKMMFRNLERFILKAFNFHEFLIEY